MNRPGVSVVIVIVMLACISLPACAAEKPQQGSQDQRSVASAINSSPNDYLAAVVSVQSLCEIRRGKSCFDRVRILDLIAQAPPPGPQRFVGSDFYLFGGGVDEQASRVSEPRMLVFVVPWPSSEKPTVYVAKVVDTRATEQSVNALRQAVQSAQGKK